MLVLASAEKLVTVCGAKMIEAARLTVDYDRFKKIVLVAAFIHDLGKCSEHFQSMLRKRRRQLVRHEAVSLWLTWPGQPLAGWLAQAFEEPSDLIVAVVAAAGHHRKFWSKAIADKDDCPDLSMDLLTDHAEFTDLLNWLKVGRSHRANIESQFQQWQDEWNDFAETGEHEQLTALVKATIIAADVAGSALRPAGKKLEWISDALGRRASRAKMREVVNLRLGNAKLREFQMQVGASNAPITFVKAGCGSGKTLAAYHWAAEQHSGKQLWVTYPTTGTTTEGYRDYVERADIKARLDHGRRLVDMRIFGIKGEGDDQREVDRLDALRAWESEAITCTVDVVLGLVQNNRKGLYAWPGLCSSAVVFDEIHSYDDKLFSCLLHFIRALPGIPVLLMTASLPNHRMIALRQASQFIHGQPLAEISGPVELEAVPRYQRIEADVNSAVQSCLDEGGKVLWVSNTVARCISVADTFPSAIVYHSHFKYIDRVDRHGKAIAAFRGVESCLLTATQVAEMSLDLSADLLVTDTATIPAMIQRLGRLNRRIDPSNPGTPKKFIVLPVANELPYSKEDLEQANRWLDQLGDKVLSQKDLVDAWADTSEQPVERGRSEWIDGGFTTVPAACRDGSVGLTVILEEDAKRAGRSSSAALECALPMGMPPKQHRWQSWQQANYLPVAPLHTIAYDPKRGGEWQK
jgi:CRISPR-associated endonuclease/helicase Cas3